MSVLRSLLLVLSIVALAVSARADDSSPIDNSALIPKLQPDSEVLMEGLSPDWVKTLIMAEVRIESATPEGTFDAAVQVLDHYARMGVNGLWITPIWERGSIGNGYVNFGPYTIEPLLTGASDIEGSYEAVKRFVDEAHRRNIRVFFDAIVWGTHPEAELVQTHPEFFDMKTTAENNIKALFNWKSETVKEWYTEAMVRFVEKTGADGFRVDLAPHTSGYFFGQVREALYARGHKVAIFSESMNDRRETFDFEQTGVGGWNEEPDYANLSNLKDQHARFGKHHDYLLKRNIVDVVQGGEGIGKASLQRPGEGSPFRYYTTNLLTHDDREPFVQGNRVRFAYTGIFTPFIPIWWIGEEWDNPRKMMRNQKTTGVMYFNTIDWSLLEEPAHSAFHEDAKRYIRIRRSHPEIFEYFPEHTRDANIAKVSSLRDGQPNPLQAYARFRNGKALLIVPNYEASTAQSDFEIAPDYSLLGLDPARSYGVRDLMSDTLLASGSLAELAKFHSQIPAERVGIYLVSPK
ncbi:MAG TPA: alpha-amylase family glycosyl hydrolase [Fimbriimonadaceae bacterium]|nr:alpha-amylase family glycosyl hydrolase [Fimbriimonadaceae bacterium]